MKGFYNRIELIAKYYDYSSVNNFALYGLLYKSSEKLNRLKNDDKDPSVRIILDIARKFQEINTFWLLTGKGKMLYESIHLSEPNNYYNKQTNLEDYSSLEIIEYIFNNKNDFYNLKSFKELIKDVVEDKKMKQMEAMLTELKDLKTKVENILPKN